MGVAAPGRSPGVHRSKTRQRGGQECQEGGIPSNEHVSKICNPWLATGSRGLQKERTASRELFKYLLGPSGPTFESANKKRLNI